MSSLNPRASFGTALIVFSCFRAGILFETEFKFFFHRDVEQSSQAICYNERMSPGRRSAKLGEPVHVALRRMVRKGAGATTARMDGGSRRWKVALRLAADTVHPTIGTVFAHSTP